MNDGLDHLYIYIYIKIKYPYMQVKLLVFSFTAWIYYFHHIIWNAIIDCIFRSVFCVI